MALHNNVSRSLNLLNLHLGAIKNFLSAAKADSYSAPNVEEFVSSLGTKIAHIESEVEQLLSTEFSQEDILNQLNDFHRDIPVLVQSLQYIRNAKMQWLPWSMVDAITEIATQIVPDLRVLVTGTLFPTYRTLPPLESPQFEYEGFSIVEIPFLERRNSPLHVLVAHELFHLVASKYVDSKSSIAMKKITEIWQPDVDAKIQELETYVAEIEQPDWINDELFRGLRTSINRQSFASHNIWKRALTEFFCDLGCLHFFGPACIFALADLAIVNGSNRVQGLHSRHHPRFEHRLWFMVEQMKSVKVYREGKDRLIAALKSAGHSRHATAFTDRMDQIETEQSEPINTANMKRVLKVAYDVLENDLKEMESYFKGLKFDESQSWFDCTAETLYHLDKLKNSVPSGSNLGPEQITGPAGNYSAIALASWIHICERYFSNKPEDERKLYLDKYLDDCNILLKSFDDSSSISKFAKRTHE